MYGNIYFIAYRSVGSDIAKGETVLERGTLLGPSELGLAASVGMERISVFKTPVVAVMSTGNEVMRKGMLKLSLMMVL